MLLTIDAGNSFVKLAYHDGTAWRNRRRVGLGDFGADAAEWRDQPAPHAVLISNVAGEQFRAPMLRVLERWGCRAEWVRPQARAYGVANAYRDPAQLGSDRWCCLVAARQLTVRAAVVASVGTAVTIDALSADGVFRGGLILPGIALMRESLAEKTAGIPSVVGQYEAFPRDTANAVHTGALTAIVGAMERMRDALSRENGAAEFILTGGAAEAVAPLITPQPRLAPDLVLEGLLRIAREEGLL